MIKYKEDGTKYYYYYQKKLGPHKKRGPKPKAKTDIEQSYSFYHKYTKKYETWYDFQCSDAIRYEYCEKMGWIEKLYPMGCRYTKKRCHELCKGYCNSEDLKNKNNILYEYIVKRKWISSMFSRYQETHKESDCYNEAFKYKTYKEFKACNEAMYYFCLHNNFLGKYEWLKDDRVSTYRDKIDAVYIYKFEELKSVYVGRTLVRRIHERDLEHLYSNDTVSKFSKDKGVKVPIMEIKETGLTIEEGLKKENYYIEYYRNLGYNIINKGKTGVGIGSIGILGKGKWNKKSCYNEALKYKRRVDFERAGKRAYSVARKMGWIDEYTWFKEKPKYNYWTFDKCKEEALKYDSRGKFSKHSKKAYSASYRNGWLDVFFGEKRKDKIFKINPSSMEIIEIYDKVSDILSYKHIYRVLNGKTLLHTDGYIYRRSSDIEINGGRVIDKLHVKDTKEKRYEKYKNILEIIKSQDISVNTNKLHKIIKTYGYEISYATCKKLRKEFFE